MKLDSVRALKAELADEVIAQAGDSVAARSFFEASRPPTPENVALGIAMRDDGEHVLAIRTEHEAIAERIAARASGEVDVRILRVELRADPYFSARRRPLEPGAQIGMAGRNFVGTLGAIVKDADGVRYGLTNAHVAADQGKASPGHRIGQPFGLNEADYVGLLARFLPYSLTVPNLVDAAIFRLDRTEVLPKWNAAIGGELRGVRTLGPEHLGRTVRKVGRTTGAQVGTVTAVEVDGLPVAMDAGTPRFDDQNEFTGGPATDFSAPGDSGSLIVDDEGYGVALLFAGGRDRTGVDFTYGNRLANVLRLLAVELAL